MKVFIKQAHLAVLFAILFVTVGWVAPAAYAAYAPADQFIEAHEFSAQDASVDSESHLICFDRTVENGRSGKVFTELYLLNNDGSRTVKVDARTMEQYFQDGTRAIETPFPLPEHLETGEYRYLLVVQMELAQGRVTREFEFQSEAFNITASEPTTTTTKEFQCG
jgi:hypothetical protein